jgi:hypothetical protein
MSVGGSIESISVRGRLFPVAADSDASLKLGGFEAEVQANGDGTARKIITRVPWSISGVSVEINHDRADIEHLQEVANSPDFEDITITFASGVTFQARGTISGELTASSMSATAEIELSGPGEATQQ